MKIKETHACNIWNLEQVERYLDADEGSLIKFYDELCADEKFLAGLNERIVHAREVRGFNKGLFGKGQVDSVDWFAFERVLLYILVRHLKPKTMLETGVYYGGNTAFILNGFHKNGSGRLVSIDYPDASIREAQNLSRHPDVGDSELYQKDLQPGFITPEYLLDKWELHLGDSHKIIPTLNETFDIYLHDSEHSYDFIKKEMTEALKKMSPSGVAIIDDIDWSNGFFSMCDEHKFFPLCLTDNGKDNLRMRTGIIKLDHTKNNIPEIVGIKV